MIVAPELEDEKIDNLLKINPNQKYYLTCGYCGQLQKDSEIRFCINCENEVRFYKLFPKTAKATLSLVKMLDCEELTEIKSELEKILYTK
jgi:hypothetical protein